MGTATGNGVVGGRCAGVKFGSELGGGGGGDPFKGTTHVAVGETGVAESAGLLVDVGVAVEGAGTVLGERKPPNDCHVCETAEPISATTFLTG